MLPAPQHKPTQNENADMFPGLAPDSAISSIFPTIKPIPTNMPITDHPAVHRNVVIAICFNIPSMQGFYLVKRYALFFASVSASDLPLRCAGQLGVAGAAGSRLSELFCSRSVSM